ncbi:hypothetical protein UFOVP549_30 [uncultured Caudovirales phage]|uniref:Uncharacterized protein n=1 Tax=uncultured Caudovirales phage TaxID=2100421 RepID=A0A6J5MYI7_9CAUD|nr:hypothetical protein UFOVP549_30 [uncultured Caudovirales phage]
MCTPQLIEAAAAAKAAQQINPQAGPVMASGGPAAVPGQNMGPASDSYQPSITELRDPISPGWVNAIQGVAGLFPPDGPRVQHMMESNIQQMPPRQVIPTLPMPTQKPMQPMRSPTVGELLGIPPGSVPGI